MTTKIELPGKLNCLRCGHEWTPRQEIVRVCPHCHSAYWDAPKVLKNKAEIESEDIDNA